ncbi:MAG: 1-acyl-sn-glycerol-3-phosphate acyltransferase [Clostridia bacterium]|nr:1-acyl-sn-glycerol-3-phosphate acyltransferase [Clostridia bacterium]
MKNKKQKRWTLPRHKLVRNIVSVCFGPIVRKKYGVKIERFKEQGSRPYLVLYNHQTAYDQFFVGLAFRGPVYYVASEDIFSLGAISSLIRFLVNPIPIKKQTTDPRAVINCIKVAKEGGTIAIAPEGNRTYSGRPVYIKPAIAQLANHLKLPIAIFKIEGGYGVHPRWSDVVRRGTMTAGVSRVIEPEEAAALSNEELAALIERELYVDEARADREYTSPRLAEYLERAMYVCPDCGLSEFESHGDVIACKKCGTRVRYTKTTELSGIDKPFPFRFVADWYDYQSSFINSLDPRKLTDKPLYTDSVDLSEVLLYKKKLPIEDGVRISLWGNRIELVKSNEIMILDFDTASAVTVLGKNKLNVYYGDKVYQFKGDARFCALKYVNIYYRYKNLTKGDGNDLFLGI